MIQSLSDSNSGWFASTTSAAAAAGLKYQRNCSLSAHKCQPELLLWGSAEVLDLSSSLSLCHYWPFCHPSEIIMTCQQSTETNVKPLSLLHVLTVPHGSRIRSRVARLLQPWYVRCLCCVRQCWKDTGRIVHQLIYCCRDCFYRERRQPYCLQWIRASQPLVSVYSSAALAHPRYIYLFFILTQCTMFLLCAGLESIRGSTAAVLGLSSARSAITIEASQVPCTYWYSFVHVNMNTTDVDATTHTTSLTGFPTEGGKHC